MFACKRQLLIKYKKRQDSMRGSLRNVLVTGATGFIGGNLVEALLRRGHAVTCLVRNSRNSGALQKLPVRLVFGDLNDSSGLFNNGQTFHAVYHVAGAIKAAGRDQYFEANQLGTRRLLKMLSEKNPLLDRFVHISSLAAAGPSISGRALTEEVAPHPTSWYGESKLASELEVLQFAETFPVTILRPSAVYGPGDRETLMIFRMIKRGCLFTPGRFTRRFSLIHVGDLAAAIIQAGEQSSPSGEVFFISRPEIYTWEDVGRAIARALGRRYRQLAFPGWIALAAGLAGDAWSRVSRRPATVNSQKVKELLMPSWLCDSSKARISIGFNPVMDLENGIRQTAEWYQIRRWL
jgi:dihydroflavonol-4-reductase